MSEGLKIRDKTRSEGLKVRNKTRSESKE